MRIPTSLQIAALAVGLTFVYTMVGQSVPQKEVHPPEVIDLPQDMTTADMVEIGKGIFEGKGICNTCHTIGKSGALRFPDLDGIATRAATRRPGHTALEYLSESMYEPNVFIVDGFSPGMPVINKPPIGLTDDEIRTVIAYLQTLGGEATITMDTSLDYKGGGAEGGDGVTASVPAEGEVETPAGGSALGAFGCNNCHYLDQPGELEANSLWDVGSSMNTQELLGELANHPSEPKLDAASVADLRAMAEELAALKGGA